MDAFDDALRNNAEYVASGRHRVLGVEPARALVVLTCMDARLDVYGALGLELGDVHVLRTAGARVTDDVLRSLTLSTHVLGTRRVLVVGHSRCGLHDPDDATPTLLRERIGHPPLDHDWGLFADPLAAIREDCTRLLNWPDRPSDFEVAGVLLDVDTGRLDPVAGPRRAEPASSPGHTAPSSSPDATDPGEPSGDDA